MLQLQRYTLRNISYILLLDGVDDAIIDDVEGTNAEA